MIMALDEDMNMHVNLNQIKVTSPTTNDAAPDTVHEYFSKSFLTLILS
jgi:hypothetical protein